MTNCVSVPGFSLVTGMFSHTVHGWVKSREQKFHSAGKGYVGKKKEFIDSGLYLQERERERGGGGECTISIGWLKVVEFFSCF